MPLAIESPHVALSPGELTPKPLCWRHPQVDPFKKGGLCTAQPQQLCRPERRAKHAARALMHLALTHFLAQLRGVSAAPGIGPGDDRRQRPVVFVNANKTMPETPASNRYDRRVSKRGSMAVNTERFSQAIFSRGLKYRRGSFRAAVSRGV